VSGYHRSAIGELEALADLVDAGALARARPRWSRRTSLRRRSANSIGELEALADWSTPARSPRARPR
jgi:hypothetical protein